MVEKKSIKEFIKLEGHFARDDSPEGEYQAKRVSQARGSLYLDMPFFGYILGHFEIYPVDIKLIQSITIDHHFIYFSAKFMEDKPVEEIKGLLMHLILHKIMKHIERGFEKNNEIWNVAADISTNLMLEDIKDKNHFDWGKQIITRFQMKYLNENTENIYTDLYEEIEQDEQLQDIDDENIKEQVKMDNLMNLVDENNIQSCELDKTLEVLEGEIGDEIEADRFKGIIRSAFESFADRDRGSLPGDLIEMISTDLYPKVPWYTILENLIMKTIMIDWSWHPPNKRMLAQNLYFPSGDKEEINLAIAIDTSGSVSHIEIRNFIQEVYGIMTSFANSRVYLIDCDSKIQQVNVYESGESPDGDELPWEGRPVKGGGGTDFIPVFDYIQDNSIELNGLIYFTDGFGLFPNTQTHPVDFPVFWIITSSVEAPFGETIHYEIEGV